MAWGNAVATKALWSNVGEWRNAKIIILTKLKDIPISVFCNGVPESNSLRCVLKLIKVCQRWLWKFLIFCGRAFAWDTRRFVDTSHKTQMYVFSPELRPVLNNTIVFSWRQRRPVQQAGMTWSRHDTRLFSSNPFWALSFVLPIRSNTTLWKMDKIVLALFPNSK